MNVLCINNAFPPTTIVFSSMEKLFFSVTENPPAKQPNNILYIAKQMMTLFSFSPKDIDFVSVVSGPGSFTGTRIGIVDGKMIAFSLNIPIVSLNSLELLAADFEEEVIPLLPAGRKEYFIARFQNGRRIEQDRCVREEELSLMKGIFVAPTNSVEKIIKNGKLIVHIPSPLVVAKKSFEKFAEGKVVEEPLSLAPLYLRSVDMIFKRMR